jgi:hypothetical protein
VFFFQTLDDIHTIDNLAHAHIAQCSAENIMLWCEFIQTFGLNEITSNFLAKEYHLKRVRIAQSFAITLRNYLHAFLYIGKTFVRRFFSS